MDDNLRFKWFARVPRKSGENREAEHTAPNKKKKIKLIPSSVASCFCLPNERTLFGQVFKGFFFLYTRFPLAIVLDSFV